MGFFKNLITGGPRHMRQDLFNSIVITNYCLFRREFSSFEEFIVGKGVVLGDGSIVKSTDLFQKYYKDYPNDDLLPDHFYKGSQALEDFMVLTFVGEDFFKYWHILLSIEKMAEQFHSDGRPIKIVGSLFADSHPSPGERVEIFKRDLSLYAAML